MSQHPTGKPAPETEPGPAAIKPPLTGPATVLRVKATAHDREHPGLIKAAETQAAILNAIPAHLALLDPAGVILVVNESWNQLATANALQGPAFGVGCNYREVCARATGDCAAEANAAGLGVDRVLRGQEREFSIEYPCPSPGALRWFRLVVTPVSPERRAGAVVMHLNITERKLAETDLGEREERFRFLNDLGKATRTLSDPRKIMTVMTRMLGEHLHASRCAYADVAADGEQFTILHDYTDGCATTVGSYGLAAFGPRAVATLTQGQTLVIRNVNAELSPAEGADTFNAIGIQAIITCPLLKEGGLRAMMAVHQLTPREWTPGEISLVQEVVERCWASIERLSAVVNLRASAEEFRTLSEAMPQIVWITRPDGGNIYFNQRWMDYTGLTPEESRGHGWNKPFHPDDRLRAWTAWQQATQTGSTYSLECRLRRTDGVYLWWLIRGVPLRDADGKILKWFGTCTDIDEFKRAQTRITEQAALIDQAQDAILVRDLDDGITFWSQGAERLFGWTAAEVLGRPDREMLQPELEKVHEAHRIVRQAGRWNGELLKTARNGTKLTLDSRWTLLRDAEGRPKSILSIDTDITERKKIEEQFLRAQRMDSLGTLAGGIAHDLNNLLAPIIMGVGVLRLYELNPHSVSVINTMERSAQRGADLVKQVLSFARGVEGARVAVQPRHILQEVEAITVSTFPKNITIETSLPNDLWPVLADPTQLNQVVLNLCVNARDAMPAGGRIELSARNVDIDAHYAVMNRGVTAGRYVVIQVTDSGCGMTKEVVDRIFEPFYTTKEVGKGTGLGLSTLMGIVRSHEGFVNVYSEPGKGSTFKVHLPALAANGAVLESGPLQSVLLRGNGELVLVVDDEAPIREITRQTLEAFGYEVITAEDGARATSLYAQRRAKVAVVLTDMMMPVMDGSALISALKHINPQVRIIAASGLSINANLARATNIGVTHFIAKPYSAETLLTKLHSVLAEKPGAEGTRPPV